MFTWLTQIPENNFSVLMIWSKKDMNRWDYVYIKPQTHDDIELFKYLIL